MIAQTQSDTYRFASNGRIVVIGDIHGHYPAFFEILSEAGLINEAGEWTGGDTTLVQMGDVFGRGDKSRACGRFLIDLEDQASKAGGRVVTLLGNHEAMVTHGCLRYVPISEICRSSRAMPDHLNPYYGFTKSLSPKQPLGRWLRSLPAAVIVDDYLFVHGGLEYAFARLGLRQLNEQTRSSMLVECDYADLPESSSIFSEIGPLWNRRFVMSDDEPATRQKLWAVLSELSAKAMIVGHTPTSLIPGVEPGEIVRKFDDQLIGVDVGIHPCYGGFMGWLEIDRGQLCPMSEIEDYAAISAG